MRGDVQRELKKEERNSYRRSLVAPPWLSKSPKIGRVTKVGVLTRLNKYGTLTSQVMASEMGRHKGTIQDAVRRMVTTWGEKIGSGTTGFFLIRHEDQKEAAVQFLFSQAESRIKRCAALLDTTPDKVWKQYRTRDDNGNGNGNGPKE
jgi:hypothetical protein